MELLTQQPTEKSRSIGAREDNEERHGIAHVAETGLDTAAVDLEQEEEEEELEAKVLDTAAVLGEQDLRETSSVGPAAPKGAAEAAAAAAVAASTADNLERGPGEQQQDPSSTQGEAKAPVADVGGDEGSGPIAAINSKSSATGGGSSAGSRSSCEDVGRTGDGDGKEEEDGGGKSKPEAGVVEAMPAVAEAMLLPAEAALARLFDTHDNFFSSDKDEKQVCTQHQTPQVVPGTWHMCTCAHSSSVVPTYTLHSYVRRRIDTRTSTSYDIHMQGTPNNTINIAEDHTYCSK